MFLNNIALKKLLSNRGDRIFQDSSFLLLPPTHLKILVLYLVVDFGGADVGDQTIGVLSTEYS